MLDLSIVAVLRVARVLVTLRMFPAFRQMVFISLMFVLSSSWCVTFVQTRARMCLGSVKLVL